MYAPNESFDFGVDGQPDVIWQGSGGHFSYRDDTDTIQFLFGYGVEEVTFDVISEYQWNNGRLFFGGTNDAFTSFHPSGAPLSFNELYLGNDPDAFYMYRGSGVGFEGSALSLSGEVASVANPCVIGDVNCDGYVEIAADIIPAFSNFTGPGSYGKTRIEGDVQGDPTGAIADLDPHDGDVDVSDLLTMFGAFTGPPTDDGGLTAAAAADPNVPDLVYDSTTGECRSMSMAPASSVAH